MKADKSICGKYAAIRYYTGANPDLSIPKPVSLVLFDKKDPSKFYWGESSSFCIIVENTELVEVFGEEKNFDKLYVKFMKKYYPLSYSEYCQSDGWLSPGGKWFTCENGHHIGLARNIIACVYNQNEDWWFLKSMGWLYLHKDGTWDFELSWMPSAQTRALRKMAEVGDGKWNRHLSSLCRMFEKESITE